MTDTDFDFDFDVDGGKPSSGARDRDSSGNGSRERDPFDALGDLNDLGKDEFAEEDREDEGGGGVLGLGRRFRPRADRERAPGTERSGSGNGDSANGAPPLAYRDGEEDPLPPRATPKPSRTPKPAREPRPEREHRTPAPADDDWLSLADDKLADDDLDSIAAPDDGPAGPRTPREGRNLARAARRRATGKSTSFDAVPARERRRGRRRLAAAPEQDFESVLESQPQKSGIAKRGSAVVYGLRGLLDHGRERVRGAGDRISHLREHVPGRTAKTAPGGNGAAPPRLPKRIGSRRPRRPKPGQVKKLRLAVIIVGLGILALISTLFGMVVSVAGDIPQLENKEQYAKAKNSEVFDSEGRRFGTLLSNSQRILVESEDISPYIKSAVVAIEDQRFYEHRGVDYLGILRAAREAFIPGGSTQGASTITQQFVKNALEAQSSRTYFQKLREASYAYHLERQWDKDKILTQYLNTIYFGEGAYGIEAAARTYFGFRYPGCGEGGADPCAAQVAPEEAAMLAGIISSPSAYSPRANPNDAGERRNLVLQKMNEQNVLSDEEYELAARQALPASSEIQKPEVDSLAPYFSEWLRQQLVDKYGPGRAFGGGLDVRTTLDLDMQEAAQSAAYNTLAGIEPTASVVVIDNETGGVKAMVGGNDFEKEPFNLATNGHRQPGSSFKPFTLITAFQNGFGPTSTFPSAPQTFTVPNSGGKEFFEVKNYDDIYYGASDLATATVHSDNSIFAQLGFGSNGLGRKGPQKVGETAERMGIAGSSFDTNPAMILGGIDPGVTPLEMAYAFSTIARDGMRVGGELDSSVGPNNSLGDLSPTGITEVALPDGEVLDGGKDYNQKEMRAIPESVASSVRSILRSNVVGGTGELAQTGSDDAWGKTGTTDNNGDAWFCGGTEHFTACVWVGHAQTNTPMETEYAGGPVDGGTFPAIIWSQVMQAVESIYEEHEDSKDDGDGDDGDSDGSSSYVAPSGGGGYDSGGGGGGGGGGGANTAPAPAPAPAAPAPSGGGGTGGTGL